MNEDTDTSSEVSSNREDSMERSDIWSKRELVTI